MCSVWRTLARETERMRECHVFCMDISQRDRRMRECHVFCMDTLARETERMRECPVFCMEDVSQRDRENERMSCVLYGGR